MEQAIHGKTAGGQANPLGEEKIGKLLRQFAVPSIIAMLVSAVYNIVDQFLSGSRWAPGKRGYQYCLPAVHDVHRSGVALRGGGSFQL